MHVTYAAAIETTRASVAMFDQALAELPDKALDWTPMSGMSPVGVLVRHAVTSTRFWMSAAAGTPRDRPAYQQEERAAAFRTRGRSVAELRAEVAALTSEVESLLARAGDEQLAAPMPWAEDDGRHRTGAECLLHGMAHLREHAGQAQVMRDLWLAASREGR